MQSAAEHAISWRELKRILSCCGALDAIALKTSSDQRSQPSAENGAATWQIHSALSTADDLDQGSETHQNLTGCS